jgi:hypothetical protein
MRTTEPARKRATTAILGHDQGCEAAVGVIVFIVAL